MSHSYEDHTELSLDATPEEVWEAIASGPGMDAWFMGRTEIEPGEGGSIRSDMGGYVQEFDITAWEPPSRLEFRTRPTEDGSFIALEWLIEGRSGTTILRSVGSGFIGSDDWESEYDSLRAGGARYLHNLAQYLEHFRGRRAVPVNAAWPQAGSVDQMWRALLGGLGLERMPAVGSRSTLRPEGLEPIEGVVDYAEGGCLGVRADDGLYRFFRGMGGMAVLTHHLFSPDADRAAEQQAWQSWLARQFA